MSETLYHGMYRGVVCDVDDPERRGRIKVQCPAVLGNYLSAWCEPCIPYATDYAGDYYVPPVGEGIWVQFENGDVDKPIWNGGWYREDSSPLPQSADPEDYRFVIFKDTVMRMGEREFVFELRNGEQSCVVTVDVETWKGLHYISTYSEEKIQDLDNLVINKEWLLETHPKEVAESFDEVNKALSQLDESFSIFLADVFPTTIEAIYTDMEELKESAGSTTEDVSRLERLVNRIIEVFNDNVDKLNATLEMIDEAEILEEETEKLDKIEE